MNKDGEEIIKLVWSHTIDFLLSIVRTSDQPLTKTIMFRGRPQVKFVTIDPSNIKNNRHKGPSII